MHEGHIAMSCPCWLLWNAQHPHTALTCNMQDMQLLQVMDPFLEQGDYDDQYIGTSPEEMGYRIESAQVQAELQAQPTASYSGHGTTYITDAAAMEPAGAFTAAVDAHIASYGTHPQASTNSSSSSSRLKRTDASSTGRSPAATATPATEASASSASARVSSGSKASSSGRSQDDSQPEAILSSRVRGATPSAGRRKAQARQARSTGGTHNTVNKQVGS